MSGCNHRWDAESSYLMVEAKFCTSCKRFEVVPQSETVAELRAEVERLTEELERLRGAS